MQLTKNVTKILSVYLKEIYDRNFHWENLAVQLGQFDAFLDTSNVKFQNCLSRWWILAFYVNPLESAVLSFYIDRNRNHFNLAEADVGLLQHPRLNSLR